MDSNPTLTIKFVYSHTLGNYEAILENGACFVVERTHIGGRLESNLDLFRQAVVQAIEGKPIKREDKSAVRATIVSLANEYVANGGLVQQAGRRKKEPVADISLEDLGL